MIETTILPETTVTENNGIIVDVPFEVKESISIDVENPLPSPEEFIPESNPDILEGNTKEKEIMRLKEYLSKQDPKKLKQMLKQLKNKKANKFNDGSKLSAEKKKEISRKKEKNRRKENNKSHRKTKGK